MTLHICSFKDVLESSFRREYEFGIVEVQKGTSNNQAYIVVKKIQELQVSIHHGILEEQLKKGPSHTLEQKQRKEAPTLISTTFPFYEHR